MKILFLILPLIFLGGCSDGNAYKLIGTNQTNENCVGGQCLNKITGKVALYTYPKLNEVKYKIRIFEGNNKSASLIGQLRNCTVISANDFRCSELDVRDGSLFYYNRSLPFIFDGLTHSKLLSSVPSLFIEGQVLKSSTLKNLSKYGALYFWGGIIASILIFTLWVVYAP